ncbi:flagellar hook-basal body complex protein [Gilvimarinus xylanilyticus]|uniref:Flagellar hook protein FlgE n=1 Tax=Gilvimarinus xylanilyticus TaxID=2944139 RepID=A0A9X2HY26_9GAMM|nr:flagellar hook-basal body complex protein [Gilvimarinus xylanilyticus]MCP8898636.1 flagellar hook-basal body complex protein [Gilvimarinus xylanilyticus]
MSFNTALSGIRAANTDLEVTGNNIANASTTGFKTSRVEFGDVYASSLLGSGSNTPGSGVGVQNIRQQFGQGNLNFTDNQLDLAVNGGGFFVVDDGGDQLFTRAGAFGLDQDGYVVTNTGYNLQGYTADEDGNVSGILSDLQVDVSTQAPRQTTDVSASINVNANQQVLETVGQSFSTDGLAVGESLKGLREPTTTIIDTGVNTGALAGLAVGETRSVTAQFSLTRNPGEDDERSVDIDIDDDFSSPDELVQEINNQILAGNINAVATLDGGVIKIQDGTEGVDSNFDIAETSTTPPAGPSVDIDGTNFDPSQFTVEEQGEPAQDNGYAPQQLVISNPEGTEVTYNSEQGASAAQTASELNALPGVSATATTTATIDGLTLDNSSQTLQLNGVVLTSSDINALADEINNLTTSTLPGISAEVVTDPGTNQDNLVLTSSVGTDLNFSFADGGSSGFITVLGSNTAGSNQTLDLNTDPAMGDASQSIVVGGQISILMDEGYEVASATPAVGNLFAPLGPASFTEVPVNQFDPEDQATYNHATSNTIFDSMGNPHVMTQYFVKQPYDPNNPSTSPNHWVMYVQVDGQEVGDPDPTLPPPENTLPTQAAFNVHFNQDGTLNESLTDTMLISNWTPRDEQGNEIGALGPLPVLQGGSTPVAEPPSSSNFLIDLAGSTQFGAEFAVEQLDQDGYTTGRLSGLDVNDSGIIFARFTNGEAQVLGQVALANFANVEALKPVGDTMWAQSADTGEAVIGAPGSASLGSINSGALEESNVDLSSQLVNLIIAQRNFQASAKTIETANQTTQTIINLR